MRDPMTNAPKSKEIAKETILISIVIAFIFTGIAEFTSKFAGKEIKIIEKDVEEMEERI